MKFIVWTEKSFRLDVLSGGKGWLCENIVAVEHTLRGIWTSVSMNYQSNYSRSADSIFDDGINGRHTQSEIHLDLPLCPICFAGTCAFVCVD